MLGKTTETNLGFPIVEFADSKSQKCSIQCSSMIDDTERGFSHAGSSYLWIGIDNPDPKVMCIHAEALGLERQSDMGWQSYEIPHDVLLTTRMHLNREQVEGMIDRLQQWLVTGDLQDE